MAGHAQRDGIGMAAHDRRLARAELARRLRQAHLAAHHAGPLGGERDFEIGLARDGTQAAGDRALERLGRRVLRRRFALMLEAILFTCRSAAPRSGEPGPYHDLSANLSVRVARADDNQKAPR